MQTTRSIRTYYTLILTQTLSIIGSRMTNFAVGIHVFNETGDVTPLALVGFFGVVPLLLASNVAGVLTDRWDRRLVLAAADVGSATGTGLLLLSFASGAFQLWHLYAIAILGGVFDVFQTPAFNAVVTTLVPDEGRDRANAVNQMVGPGAGLLAPFLAGMLFGLVGVVGVMAIDLLTFAVAVGVVLRLDIPRPPETDEGRESRGSVWFEARMGFAVVWRRRLLFYAVLYIMLHNFLGSMAGILFTPYVLTLTDSEALLGTLMAIMNGGMFLGGVLAGAWHPPLPRMTLVLGAMVLISLGMIALGVARSPLALGIVFALYLVPNAISSSRMNSILQAKIPPDIQGRVMAALIQMALLATPLSLLLVGPLVDHVLEPAVGGPGWGAVAPLVGERAGSGMGLLLVINGAISTAVGLAMLAWPDMRHLEDRLPDPVPLAEPAIA
ncbi:MAG: MFS transporter [Chloroflexi bacterium]|nr:MFS transporter [Chloroflexota bacterium]